jgi:NitT/TauT family transport system substrate-binding protein
MTAVGSSRYRVWVPGLIGLLSLAMILAACGTAQDVGEPAEEEDAAEPEEAPGEVTSITFALTNQRTPQYSEYYIADYMGYWEDEGLDVEIVIVSGSPAVVQQIIAGNVEIGHPSAPATAQAVAQGNCLVQFYTSSYGNVFGFVVKEDSGITSLDQLEGEVVGISEPSGGEVPLVRGILSGVGLRDGVDYQMLEIGEGGPVTHQALENEDATAYSSSVFDIASLSAAGIELRSLLPDEFFYFPTVSLVTTCDYYESEPEVLTAFARAVTKGKIFAETNEEAALEIAEYYEPELFEQPELVQEFWETVKELNARPPALEGALWGSHYRQGWEDYFGFAGEGTVEEGALDVDAIDLDVLLGDDLLEDINDFDEAAVIEEAQNFEGVQ